MDEDWLPDENYPEDFHNNFQTDFDLSSYTPDQSQNNSNGKRVVWTNAQIRTLLRAISGAWNGLFQTMLEDLSKEEKRQKTRELGQGWSVVHKMFLKEYPDSNLSSKQLAEKFRKLALPPGSSKRSTVAELLALHQGWSVVHKMFLKEYPVSNLSTKQLAEKFRKLALPPGSSKRSTVAELLALHQGSAMDPSKEVRLHEDEGLTGGIHDSIEDIIEQDNAIDDQDPDFDVDQVLSSKKSSKIRHRKTRHRLSPPKKISRNISDLIKSDSRHLVQHNEETISTNCDILKKRKHELELEILELEGETQLRKAEVYELIRGKLERNEYDLSALLNIPDNIALG